MASKKDSAAADKKRKTTVKKLEGRIRQLEASVERANARAERWKKRAKQHRSDDTASRAEVERLRKKLVKSRRQVRPSSVPVPAPVPAAAPDQPDDVAHGATPGGVAPVDVARDADRGTASTSAPDASWTVTALRAEARSRGIAGYSRKSKADLLAALA